MQYSNTQKERLVQLNIDASLLEATFEDAEARDASFRSLEKELAKKAKTHLRSLLSSDAVTGSQAVGNTLCSWLQQKGFTRVDTPNIISDKMLDKMSIDDKHHLREQVFWIDRHKCLRPMLAPNLYIVMRELKKTLNTPVKIFEMGSCFRKESQGARHMNEFTMLNFVELATVKDGEQKEYLEKMAREAMAALKIDDYELIIEESTVYGTTVDIEIDGIEVASGAYGPHELDSAWAVFDTWVGIGFGIERLAMAMNGGKTIKRFGRSTNYLDGVPISL